MTHPRPPATGLTTASWRRIPPMMVPVRAVIPTQDITHPEWVAAKADDLDSHCGDPYSHVVVVNGRWLIEDGHHRHAYAVTVGEEFWPARVYVMPGNPQETVALHVHLDNAATISALADIPIFAESARRALAREKRSWPPE